MQSALRKINEYITQGEIAALLRSADHVVVAFSGGADSAFLLCLLSELSLIADKHLEACHLNHMIRGEEADRDEGFCRRRCCELGIPLSVKRVDVPALARESGMSMEAAARQARYDFFDEICHGSQGRTLIATAHNADDNLETVIFNLLRGSAARGMCGIPPVRDCRYIRPLLPFTGREIRETCERLGLEYVVDSTNFETDYTRNRIRHFVVPELEKLTRSPQAAALRMTQSLREDADYLEGLSAELPLSDNGTSVSVGIAGFPDPVLSRVIKRMYENLNVKEMGEHIHIEHSHIREIMKMLRDGKRDFVLHTPGKSEFFCTDSCCGFRRKSHAIAAPTIDRSESIVLFDGEPIIKNGYEVRFLSEKSVDLLKDFPGDANIYNLSIHKRVRFDKISGNLIVRCRRQGDSYRYGGMTRRVKKIMSERHIDVAEREVLPVICDGEGILWIPGFPIRDGMDSGDGETAYILCRKTK